MTIAGSERRCSMPLFYRRGCPRATISAPSIAVELVGADRVVPDAGFGEHFLHGLDQSGRSRHVVDERREILQMALEHGAVEKPPSPLQGRLDFSISVMVP